MLKLWLAECSGPNKCHCRFFLVADGEGEARRVAEGKNRARCYDIGLIQLTTIPAEVDGHKIRVEE